MKGGVTVLRAAATHCAANKCNVRGRVSQERLAADLHRSRDRLSQAAPRASWRARFTAEPPGATGLTLSRYAFTIVISSAFTVNMPFTPRPGPPTTDSGRPQSILMSPYPMVHHEKCRNVQIRGHFTARPENAPTVNNLFTVRQYHHNMVPRAFGYAKQVPM